MNTKRIPLTRRLAVDGLDRVPPATGFGAAFRSLLVAAGMLIGARESSAWEGHDWEAWKGVTTWRRPEGSSQQAGRTNLVPLLGGDGRAPRVASRQDWEVRRGAHGEVLRALLGAPTALRAPAVPEVRELGSEERDGYTRRHVMIRASAGGDDWIPAYVLVPARRAAERVPVALCLHQTVAQGKDEPGGIRGDPELAFAAELARRGWIAVAPDMIGFGERIPPGRQPYHDSLAFYRRHPGWSFFGKMIWDVGRVIDYVETLPFADATRIASLGHSHGAYGTLFAAAFEPRIAAAAASCGFTPLRGDPHPERWSHLTALLPQLGFYLPDVADIPFDWHHVLALVAPRPLFVWYSTRDAIFPGTERLGDLLWDVQGVYDLHGAADALKWQPFEGGHQFPRAGRERVYRWLEDCFDFPPPGAGAVSGEESAAPAHEAGKSASAFFPAARIADARENARRHPWAAAIRDPLVAAAAPWREMSDDALWELVFGNGIRRAWQVWSDGHCPSCREPVPMYEWVADALGHPWKLRCPRCREWFPKNDFAAFHRSGLNARGVFEAWRADRSLLFHAEHPDPADPRHRFGVDDGEGYVADGHRWRFVGAYLIFGQWKQAIVAGIRNLAAAYVATGDPVYAHKAGVLLDRVADVYPDFDFGREGVMYEGAPRTGYVSTWHDACVEVQDLALAYDAVFEAIARDADLVTYLAGRAARHRLPNPKTSFAAIGRNIEDRIFRDTLAHRWKIESNYPSTDVALTTLRTVLDWPRNRVEVMADLDAIVARATAVDGLTGEKGITGYSVIAPHAIAALLGRYARAEPGFLAAMVRRHPRLHAMYRFHLDTWCLGLYYPRTGDTGSFAERTTGYAGLPFTRNPGTNPSSYAFLGELFEATGDPDFVRLLHHANGGSTEGLPYDLFAADPAAFQARVAGVLGSRGAELRPGSVNKEEWGLAILRAGRGPTARALWLDYDSGERHGHADGMNIGLFAHGLDLLPDFGYPPVQYGGWLAPRAVWYTQTPAHNTVTVDGRNTRPGTGRTALWFDGQAFRAVRASGPDLNAGRLFERALALVDLSPEASYVVDVFRVEGGTEHTRFLRGTFGRLESHGLSLEPEPGSRFGPVMRGFRRDPAPAPGWSVDWQVEDHLKYLPAGTRVGLRHTELTSDVAVETGESWVAVGLYGGTAEAWVPGVLVSRRTTRAPLASTFVGVLEPHGGTPRIASARRLALRDAENRPCPDRVVGLEIRLADGRNDLVLARGSVAEPSAAGGAGTVVEPATGLVFDGDTGFVRFAADGRPERVAVCRGRSLRVAGLTVALRDATAGIEIDLSRPENPVVAGPPEAVEFVELDGVRLWPR